MSSAGPLSRFDPMTGLLPNPGTPGNSSDKGGHDFGMLWVGTRKARRMHLERTVQHLLGEKGRDVWSVSSDTTVYEALEYMAEKGIGAVVVIDDGNLSGIFSERDYARKVVLMGRHSRDMKVAELMSTDVITAAMTDSVMTCMTVMSERRFRHLPVVEDGDVVGVVSIGDVVRNVIEEQRYLIDQLQQYITS